MCRQCCWWSTGGRPALNLPNIPRPQLSLSILSVLCAGEAQKIDRIINSFGLHFYKHNQSIFLSSDAAYILAYSVIMLNTDRHNQGVSEAQEVVRSAGRPPYCIHLQSASSSPTGTSGTGRTGTGTGHNQGMSEVQEIVRSSGRSALYSSSECILLFALCLFPCHAQGWGQAHVQRAQGHTQGNR